MLYVCLAEAAALVLTVSMFGAVIRSLIRQQARERDLLLNKMLHSVGRPWVPAPADEAKPDPEPQSWTWAPEQLPVYGDAWRAAQEFGGELS